MNIDLIYRAYNSCTSNVYRLIMVSYLQQYVSCTSYISNYSFKKFNFKSWNEISWVFEKKTTLRHYNYNVMITPNRYCYSLAISATSSPSLVAVLWADETAFHIHRILTEISRSHLPPSETERLARDLHNEDRVVDWSAIVLLFFCE